MAHHIQVVFAAGNLAEIDLCGEDAFSFVIGSGQDLAEGIDDAASTADQDDRWVIALDGGIVGGVVAPSAVLATG